MASEYLKWKARDVKPDAPPPPMSRRDKLKNWFYYHKWWLAAGAVLIWIAGSMLWNVLGIGKIKPDYIFAYIGSRELSEDRVSAFEEAAARLGTDVNGDGRVSAELRQYVPNRRGDIETAMYYNYAADTVLLADITSGESYFFIMEDPSGVQRTYHILANSDGSAPDDTDIGIEGRALRLSDCPALGLDEDGFPELYIGRRCFYGDMADGHEAEEALWEALTEGAVQ